MKQRFSRSSLDWYNKNMKTSNKEYKDYTDLEDAFGDAMDVMGCDDIDDDEVLSSSRFGRTEMEDTLGDTLDEMGYDE